MDTLLDLLDPKWWLTMFGAFATIGVLLIIFAETGLLFGFFLPGDSLLVAAGIFAVPAAAAGLGISPLSLPVLLIGGPVAAIAGAQLGHYLGAKVGRKLFERPDSRLFKQEHVRKAEYYFEKFGPAKAVVLARFVPIVRTFLNPVAGVLGMDARRFFLWNVLGGVVWIDALVLFGYFVGNSVPNIERYILPGVFVIVVVSFIPIVREVIKNRKGGGDQAEDAAVPAAATATATASAAQATATQPSAAPDPFGRPGPGGFGAPASQPDPFDAFQQAINAQINANRPAAPAADPSQPTEVFSLGQYGDGRPGGPYPGDARPGATYGTGAPQGDPYADGRHGARPYGGAYQGDPFGGDPYAGGSRYGANGARSGASYPADEYRNGAPHQGGAYGGDPYSAQRPRAGAAPDPAAGAQRSAEPDWQAWRAWQDPEHDR